MSSKKQAVKNLAFSSLGVYVEYFFMMVMSVIIARTLGPESYGVYALILWACAFSLKVTNGGVTTALIKYISECRVKYPEFIAPTIKYLKKIQVIKLTIVISILLIVYFYGRETYLKGVGIEVVMFLLIAIILRAIYMVNVSVAKGFENFKATAAIAVISSPIHLLLVAVCALLFGDLTSFVIAYTFSALIYFWFLNILREEAATTKMKITLSRAT